MDETRQQARKTYLGDSVYASVSEWGEIVLTTENGGPPSNTILLEPEVLDALLAFATKVRGDR